MFVAVSVTILNIGFQKSGTYLVQVQEVGKIGSWSDTVSSDSERKCRMYIEGVRAPNIKLRVVFVPKENRDE
jgi:hypothetical protein